GAAPAPALSRGAPQPIAGLAGRGGLLPRLDRIRVALVWKGDQAPVSAATALERRPRPESNAVPLLRAGTGRHIAVHPLCGARPAARGPRRRGGPAPARSASRARRGD